METSRIGGESPDERLFFEWIERAIQVILELYNAITFFKKRSAPSGKIR